MPARCSPISSRTVWIDFRGIQDAFMRGKGIDYFENSRRATYDPAAICDRQSTQVQRLWRKLLGHHRQRRPRPGDAHLRWDRARFFRLPRTRCAVRAGRRHDRTVGGRCVLAVCAGDRVAGHRSFLSATRICTTTIATDSRRRSIPLSGLSPNNPCGWISPWHFGLNLGPIVLDDRKFPLRDTVAVDEAMSAISLPDCAARISTAAGYEPWWLTRVETHACAKHISRRSTMELGMIGLGRMGANMAQRLTARRTSRGRLRPERGRAQSASRTTAPNRRRSLRRTGRQARMHRARSG